MRTEEELFQIGKDSLHRHLLEQKDEVLKQLSSTRDHYETGHCGRHPIPAENSPLDAMYEILAHNLLEWEFARNAVPDKHGRLELLSQIMTSLVFAVVPPDMKWVDFEKHMIVGVEKFFDRQVAGLDEERNREMIVKSGMIISDMQERFAGKAS